MVLSRTAWLALRDALYRLESAAEDVALDLAAGRPTREDYLEALAHLGEAVRELLEVSVEPTAIHPS